MVNEVEGKSYAELAELFNEKFKADTNASGIRQKCYALKVKNNVDPKFQKGQIPPSTKPTGAESIDEDGNPIIKIGQPRRWKKKSHVVWEKYNGPVPENHFVIFLNQDKKDCRIKNLSLVSRSTFYQLVHSGMYSENEDITRVGITMTLLKQKITEHEEEKKKEATAVEMKCRIETLEKENAQLKVELERNRFIAECFYLWGFEQKIQGIKNRLL